MKGNLQKSFDKALFHAALEFEDPEDRHAFLLKSCGDDVAQFSRVSDLLSAQAVADKFFHESTLSRSEISGEVGKAVLNQDPHGENIPMADMLPESELGSYIDRYRLSERIGEGGCGIVYLAEQIEPFHRNVALKVIRRGLDTERIITRFEMERQTLALMDHPNIARVFDAGTTVRGRPYFVMELVHGKRITDHCNARKLTLAQRLGLFLQVCQAIQHAHQKGIIHRDIKPSNILISCQNDGFIPKVIDFGIARAIEHEFIGGAEPTTWGPFIGTPAYMSPEQVDGGHEADTRSDVYGLGALLYELLAGQPPFDSEHLAKVGILEMSRILHEVVPPSPSSLLCRIAAAELAAIAAARDSTPTQLISAVKRDLDWIVIKSIAKNMEDRYESVDGLAMDIQRYLNGEPILARPPSRLYPLGKWILRNKLAFAASSAGVLALIIGFTISSWFYYSERESRQEQEKLRVAAESARANEARLLQQSKARESISQAAMLLAEGKTEEADALLLKTPLTSIYPSMEAANVFRALGDWNAIRQRWKQASECYSLYLQSNFLYKNPSLAGSLLNLISVGSTLVLAGDFAGYDHFRTEILAKNLGSSFSPINSAILLKACLLMPADESLLKQLHPSAKKLPDILADEKRAGMDSYQSAFLAMSLALIEYRQNNFPVAQYWCRRCLDYPDENEARSATAHAIAAMAAYRLGQLGRARSELALAKDFFEVPFTQDNYYPRGKGQGHWQDWAIAKVLLHEASAQISGSNQ